MRPLPLSEQVDQARHDRRVRRVQLERASETAQRLIRVAILHERKSAQILRMAGFCLCFGLLLHRLVTSEERHHCKHYGDDQPERDSSERNTLASRRRFAASDDVFGLERRRLSFLLRTSFRKPSLSRAQIFTAQDKALAPAASVPFYRSGEQTRVRTHPFEVRIECADQLVSSFLKIVTVPAENPVQLSERFRYPIGRHVAMDDRHETLIIRRCVRDFLTAHLGCNRIG